LRKLIFPISVLLLTLPVIGGCVSLWNAPFSRIAPTTTSAPIANLRPPGISIQTSEIPTEVVKPSVDLPAVTPSTPVPDGSTLQADSATASIPVEHFLDIQGHKQYFPLGCEAAAAKDWANYFGKDFNEFEFQFKLPQSDNPDLGFVGSVEAPWGQVPPYGYGVHAGPVADLLNAYGIPAKAYKGYTLAQIRAKIADDKPVIAWVIGNVVGGVPYEYTDKEGNKVIVAAYEHVVIVTGYNATHIRYMNNGKFYDSPDTVFLNSWGVLGNMVIVDQ
jgi:uncharacterized protein YvpB